MTVATNTPFDQYIATGGQTVFTYTFEIVEDTDLLVYQRLNTDPANDITDVLVLNVDYTVTGVGNENGGTVILNTGATLNDIITLKQNVPVGRDTSFTPGGILRAQDLNSEFDNQTLIEQVTRFNEQNRMPRYWDSEIVVPFVDTILPRLAAQQVWRMNENGTGIEAYTLDNVPAPSNAYFLTYGEDASLENEQNLALLGNGLLKQSVTGGFATLALAIPGVDYLDPGVPLGTMAYQNANNVNITGGSANLTAGQVATSPTLATDLVNKAYADSIAAGFIFKSSCYATTTTNLSATYANGASGVGATLTATGNGVLSMDGVNPPALSRVCVTDQTNTFENGIYLVTDAGSGGTPFILTRATDFDSPSEITPGSIVFIQEGTIYGDTSFVETEIVATIGTDPILFIQFSQTYPLSMGNGGTGANIAPVVNSLVYSTASNMALIAPENSSVLVYSASGVPSASTTLPANLVIPTPRIAQINDVNGNAVFTMNINPSAVNNWAINNSATGNAVQSAPIGTDTNISRDERTKGTGQFLRYSAHATIPFVWNTGTGYQHSTSWAVPNTAASRTVTLQDADGTMAYLADRDWVRLGSATASSSAAITFTGLTGYTSYMLVWDSIFAATSGAILWMQGSINNGSTWLSSAPAYYQQSMFAVGAALTAGSDITTLQVAVLSSSNSNIGTNVNNGYMILENLALVTGSRPGYTGQTVHINTTPTIMGMSFWGQIRDPGSPVNAIRLFMSTGNIVSGTVQIYGMK